MKSNNKTEREKEREKKCGKITTNKNSHLYDTAGHHQQFYSNIYSNTLKLSRQLFYAHS